MGNVYVFSRIKDSLVPQVFVFFYDCVAVGVVVITVLGAEVKGGVPDFPLFKPFLPRAPGEELSAG